ncbi:hypothetical protein CLU79DRAFT_127352 [Phycomyces nitens]|nr:hypothetical protein CLU79DRAFT_127352 [Phycomyces nitens]
MLASELPIEIVHCIANCLEPRDKTQCCLVNNTWLPVFQESLFETITIYNYTNFAELVGISSLSSTPLQRYGHNTRALRISKKTGIDDQQLSSLQKAFPSIKRLEWDRNNCDNDLFTDNCGWHLWGSLVDLKIAANQHDSDQSECTFYSILPHLGRLERLEFRYEKDVLFGGHSLASIEILNDQLPRLTLMSPGARLDSVTLEEILSIRNIKPMPRLKTLDVIINLSAYEWLYYIALKYPNLTTLKTIVFSQAMPMDQNCEAAKMFGSLSSPLRHLKDIDVKVDIGSEDVYIEFLNKLSLCNIPIKTMSIVLTQARSLEYYPNLVDLSISTKYANVDVDILLDKCPSLKTFCITWGTLRLSPGVSPLTRHGLTSLSLYISSATIDILQYISLCCRNLKNMKLDCVVITRSVLEHAQSNCIDMSSTHFTKLSIGGLRISDSVNFKAINIFSLSSLTNPKEPTWVYSIFQQLQNHKPWISKIWKLDQEESRQAKEYFDGRTESIEEYNTINLASKKRSPTARDSWRMGLGNGFSTFKYGSAKSLVFESAI